MYVIAVAGTSGAGKTSLARLLVERLDGSFTLDFEEYEGTSQVPSDLFVWAKKGGDPNKVRTPRLVDDLRRFRSDSRNGYLILQEPFGRSRAEISPLVDLCVFLKVSIETGLTRKMLGDLAAASRCDTSEFQRKFIRDLSPNSPPEVSGAARANLEDSLARFIDHVRAPYLAIDRSAEASCDLVLDGEWPLVELAEDVMRELKRRGQI